MSTSASPVSSTPTWRWVVVVALGALLVGLVAGPVLAGAAGPRPTYTTNGATDQPPEHTISVTGSGKVVVVPDMATVDLGVMIERPNAKAARADAAAAMTKVVAAIRALGIDDKDIKTVNVSLNPVYDYPNNASPRIRGYQLNNTVTVTVRDLDKLSDVLDNGVQAGATSVNGISFDVADRVAAEAKARDAAVADAKAKAEALASGLGVRIEGVASVTESSSTPVWYDRSYAAGAASDVAAETPVMAGTSDITITVQITFLIP
jgi:uncharacterized protein YggE